MPYRITVECIFRGACLAECPADAVAEGDPAYVIDPSLCSDGGNCAEVCPVDACVSTEPEER